MHTSPVTAWRQVHNLSLGEFAKAARTSRVAVQRTEAGVYSTVLPAIVDALLDRPTYLPETRVSLLSSSEIQAAYRDFQNAVRRQTYLDQALSPTLPNLSPQAVGVFPSPVVHWRLSSGVSSQLSFCKLLCVHPHVVNQIESGVQRKLPKQLVAALSIAGYDDGLIHDLSERQAAYYDSSNT